MGNDIISRDAQSTRTPTPRAEKQRLNLAWPKRELKEKKVRCVVGTKLTKSMEEKNFETLIRQESQLIPPR